MRRRTRSRLISFGNPFLTRGGRTNLERRRHFAGRSYGCNSAVVWLLRLRGGWADSCY